MILEVVLEVVLAVMLKVVIDDFRVVLEVV